MKKALSVISLMLILGIQHAMACNVCESNQPKVLKNITHGTGPQGNLDFMIIGVAVIIVTATLLLSIKYLCKPDENNADHIKNSILNTPT